MLLRADLASDITSPTHERLVERWVQMLRYADTPAEKVAESRASLGTRVALLPPGEVASLIASAGFAEPKVFEALLIHGWVSRRPA